MSQEFDQCLVKGKIKQFSPGPKLAKKELKLAEDDLKISLRSIKDENYKWSIIQSYYSMFHSARSLLYCQSYREKSHFCLIEAVRTLFVEKGHLDMALVESLAEAKALREAADYYGDFSEINCKKLATKAKEFLAMAKKLSSKMTKN
jgi:uncharacterized protein (UPF0332 family)